MCVFGVEKSTVARIITQEFHSHSAVCVSVCECLCVCVLGVEGGQATLKEFLLTLRLRLHWGKRSRTFTR